MKTLITSLAWLIVVFVLYVLSIAPVNGLWVRGWLPVKPEILNTIYRPVIWMTAETPIGGLLHDYGRLFAID